MSVKLMSIRSIFVRSSMFDFTLFSARRPPVPSMSYVHMFVQQHACSASPLNVGWPLEHSSSSVHFGAQNLKH